MALREQLQWQPNTRPARSTKHHAKCSPCSRVAGARAGTRTARRADRPSSRSCSHLGLPGPAPGERAVPVRLRGHFADWPDHEVITLIEHLLYDLRHGLATTRAGAAIPVDASRRPAQPRRAYAQRSAAPAGSSASLVARHVRAAQAGEPTCVDLAEQLLDTGDLGLARQIAHAFGIQRVRTNVLDGEPVLLRTLVEHPDPDGIVPCRRPRRRALPRR